MIEAAKAKSAYVTTIFHPTIREVDSIVGMS